MPNYKAILTDIEGTTSSIDSVVNVLFPYARKGIEAWLKSAKAPNKQLEQALEALRLSLDSISQGEALNTLLSWMDQDKKDTQLKNIQGLLWEDGYKNGVLKGQVFKDVVKLFRRWKKRDVGVYIYSSGSVHAQKLLFSHSDFGDLTPLIKGYFDTNIGTKRETKSYEDIAKMIGILPQDILFLSDIPQELDAAKGAGMDTTLVIREGNKPVLESKHRVIHSFEELEVFPHDKLRIFDQAGNLIESADDDAEIAKKFAKVGIRFEQWEASSQLTDQSTHEEIKHAYAKDIAKLIDENGYQHVDVVHMYQNHPDRAALRAKFLNEHTHSEDEVRFFVNGAGLFSLHIDDCVYCILCQRGDLISVPAGTPHWFDMSEKPNFTAIRFFNNPEGWIAKYSEPAGFERAFPLYELTH